MVLGKRLVSIASAPIGRYNSGVTRLVGRDHELARLQQALAAARLGQGSAVVLTGEAGIGKSALLDTLASETTGFQILRATGRESERELPFAGLAALLDPILDLLPSLPTPQAAALRGALALEDIPVADPLGVAVGTLGLLGRACAKRPLLCIVDDMHWLDASSAGVILFAANRIGDLSAVMVLAARAGEPWPRGLDALASLPLTGLSEPEGVELLTRDLDHPVVDGVARELVRRTGGNALALLELQNAVDADQLAGRTPLTEPLRVGTTVETLFLRRVESLPKATRAALLRAAADEHAPFEPAALEPAELAGVIVINRGRVEFTHPLLRSAVYHGAAEPDRRRAHAEIAASIDPHDPSPRRPLHRARAATGPDETIAVELENSARRALARAGVREAGALLELAAEMTPAAAARVRRLAEAGWALVFSGELERARLILDRAEEEADDDPSRVAIDRTRGAILLWSGQVMEAHRVLVGAGERASATDRGLAATILTEAVWAAQTAADIRAASASASRAADLAKGLGGHEENRAAILLLRTLIIAGEAGTREDVLPRLRRLFTPRVLLDSAAAGYWLTFVWLEDFDAAASSLAEGIRQARAGGILTSLPLLLATMCELETWRGDLRGALLAGGEAEQLCLQLGNNVAYPYVLAVLARAEAFAGREEDAEGHARAALEFSRPRGIDSIEIYVACARGALALGHGRHADVVAELEPLRAMYRERGIGEPNSMPWLGDLAEAALLSGKGSVADGALADLDRMADRTGSRWAGGVAARARVLRMPLEGIAEEIGRAASLLHDMPFELARVHLIHGERLRALRHRADAREPLRRALAGFERIGARRWADRARRELAAAGEIAADGTTAPEQLLSPQELQVAFLVSEGLTNREAAERLIVSPKTIEYHLGNAFRKLGVRSRVELVKRLRTG